jgi:hypothetical protein
MTRRLSFILVSCLTFVLALACVPRPAGAVDPYEINVVLGLTGPYAFIAKARRGWTATKTSSTNPAASAAGR